MRVSAGVVPNFFTMANMFCGYLSVMQSAQGKFVTAAWLIIAAGVLDMLDGKLARLTNATSDFGVQYDSLADVTSFGLATSALAYFSFFHRWGIIGILLSFLPLVFGSIRLARFNVDALSETRKNYFEGLPIPAAAVTLATFVIYNMEYWQQIRWSKVFLMLMILVSLLMISTVRYEKMPEFSFHADRTTRWKILLVLLAVLSIILFPQELFLPWCLVYVFSGPIRLIVRVLFPRPEKEIPQTEREPNESSG